MKWIAERERAVRRVSWRGGMGVGSAGWSGSGSADRGREGTEGRSGVELLGFRVTTRAFWKDVKLLSRPGLVGPCLACRSAATSSKVLVGMWLDSRTSEPPARLRGAAFVAFGLEVDFGVFRFIPAGGRGIIDGGQS